MSETTSLRLARAGNSVRDSRSGLGVKPVCGVEEQDRFIFVAKDLDSFPVATLTLIQSDNAILQNGIPAEVISHSATKSS